VDRLRRWWGPREEPPPGLAASRKDLERLGSERPEWASAARSLGKLLDAAFLVPSGGEVPETLSPEDEERVRRCWGRGIPCFRELAPPIGWEELRGRALDLCRALAAENPSAPPLRAAIRRGEAPLSRWAHEYAIAGRPGEVVGEAREMGLDGDLLASVLNLALLPSLAGWSRVLDRLRQEGSWRSGGCPHCGHPARLAESRGIEQGRHLRCGLCAADWPADRLRCSFCGEGDPRALRSWHVEGEEARHRLAACGTCGGRLRVVSTLAPLGAPGLLVADLATIHLDFVADPEQPE
jgi:hypothetical protein